MSKYKWFAAMLAAIIGGGLYFSEPPKPKEIDQPKKVEQSIQGMGFIDIAKVNENLPDGEKLRELVRRELRLKLELDALMTPFTPPQLPEIQEKPFEDAARAKHAQYYVEKFAELQAKKKQLLQQFTDESEEEYLRRRDEETEKYSNEALNITLKLQNAKVLQLTAEQVTELQDRLEELVTERNLRQKEIQEQWIAEINERVARATASEESRLKNEVHEAMQDFTDDAAKKIQETQERNKKLAEAALKEIEARQKRRQEISEELAQVTKERSDLEEKILRLIEESAGKLGAIYRLEMIFVKRNPDDSEKILSGGTKNFKLNDKKSLGALIYPGKDTKNLTNDLIKELKLKGLGTEK